MTSVAREMVKKEGVGSFGLGMSAGVRNRMVHVCICICMYAAVPVLVFCTRRVLCATRTCTHTINYTVTVFLIIFRPLLLDPKFKIQ